MTCPSRCAACSQSTGNLSCVDRIMSDEVTQRLDRVEANLAHLEHQVEQLNGVIVEQGRELEQLKKLVQRQGSTLESIELERVKSTNPKPPHY